MLVLQVTYTLVVIISNTKIAIQERDVVHDMVFILTKYKANRLDLNGVKRSLMIQSQYI